MSIQKKSQVIASAVETAEAFGDSLNVDNVDSLLVQIATESSYDGKIQCYGSGSATEPTWANAQTPANILPPKRMYDLDDGSSVTGSTGISPAGADIVKEFKINVEQLRWINFGWSARTAGKLTVRVVGMSRTRFKG